MKNRFLNKITFIVILLHCLLSFDPVIAQTRSGTALKAMVDRNRIQLGERIQLTVRLEYTQGRKLSRWIAVPDSLNHLEVLERGNIDSIRSEGKIRFAQTFVLTGFDSGHWVIPSFSAMVDKQSVKTDTVGIDIIPTKLKGQEYHDIKEIIEVPNQPGNWKIWLAIAISVVLLAVLAWNYLNRPKKVPVVQEFDTKLSPHDQAMQELKKLKDEKIAERGEVKLYYSRLYDIYRIYLQRQFGMPVLQGTTDELLVHLKEDGLPKEQFSKLAESLRIADATKFAKYIPSADQCNKSYHVIHESIRLQQQQKQQQQKV